MALSVCVHLSVCLSVCQSICLHVCLSVRQSVCLSVCMSVCPSICLHVYLSVCLSVCLFVYLSVWLSAIDFKDHLLSFLVGNRLTSLLPYVLKNVSTLVSQVAGRFKVIKSDVTVIYVGTGTGYRHLQKSVLSPFDSFQLHLNFFFFFFNKLWGLSGFQIFKMFLSSTWWPFSTGMVSLS